MGDLEKNLNSNSARRQGALLAAIAAIGFLLPAPLAIATGSDGKQGRIRVSRPESGVAPAPSNAASLHLEVPPPVTNPTPSDAGREPDLSASLPADSAAESEVTNDRDIESLDIADNTAERSDELPPRPTDAVRELSVAPGTQPLLPADRPAWVGAQPELSSDIHRLSVGSLPTSNIKNADRSLDEPLMAAVNAYIDQHVLDPHDGVRSVQMHVDENYIRKNLIDHPEGYVAELKTSEGPMYQKWVSVHITPDQREQIRQWHREAVQRERLAPLGLGLLSVVGLIGLSHLVLRRRHGLPEAQPLSREQLVSQDSPAVPHKRSGPSMLAVLGCILILPAMVACVLVYIFFARQAHVRHYQEAVRAQVVSDVEQHEQAIRARALSEIPSHRESRRRASSPEPVLPELPAAPATSGLHDSSAEVKLEPGGQVIIIRKSDP